MATLEDIYTIATGINPTSPSTLYKKVVGALVQVAREIYDEDPSYPEHDTRKLWARNAMGNPMQGAEAMIWRVVTDNGQLSSQQIINLPDADILISVRRAVDNWVNSL